MNREDKLNTIGTIPNQRLAKMSGTRVDIRSAGLIELLLKCGYIEQKLRILL